jgi:peroxiredoxin
LPLAVVVAIVGGLLYMERADGPGESGAEGIVALPPEKNPTGEDPSPQVGRAAPDFLLETPDGGTERLSDHQGHAVLVNFWATWCRECREEMPELVKAYSLYRDEGFVILGVDVQESDSQVRRFVEEFGMDYPIAMDRSGEVARAYRATGVPETFFIDRTGVIKAKFMGPLEWEDLEEYLERII